MSGHSHGDPDWSLSAPLRRIVWLVLGSLAAVTVAGLVLLWPDPAPAAPAGSDHVAAVVRELGPCVPAAANCQLAVVEVTEGDAAGTQVELNLQAGEGAPQVAPDVAVWLNRSTVGGEVQYGFADVQRDRPLLLLAALFAGAVVLLSRWKGVAALAGLAVSIWLLAVFVLPALVQGTAPLAVAAVGASAIAITTMGLAHGFSMRTGVALVGTVVALLLTAVLGSLFSSAARFTGVAGEDAFYLQNMQLDVAIDLRGLFLAGLVIGALGVLDDVTVTQAATVWEVRRADPTLGLRPLFAAGMRVGRDHVAATVNTLVLAYIGASLPLFLVILLSSTPLTQSLGSEFFAQEIVRSLVGSLGIVAAVPITTFAAAWLVTRPTTPSGPTAPTEPAATDDEGAATA